MPALFLLTLPLTLHVYKAWWDYYSGYSGTVVDKGWEFHVLGGYERYLVLRQNDGTTFKKYVGYYDHAFAHVGSFVEKKKGFGQCVLSPGQKTPAELRQEAEKIQRSRARQSGTAN